MSYDTGTFIDLSYLNKKSSQPEQTSQSRTEKLLDVGTQFIFNLTPSGLQAAIKIPVTFAS